MMCSCNKSTKLWAAAILVIIIIGSLTLFAYTSEQKALKGATNMGMEGAVSVMATQLSAGDLANITPGNENSPAWTTPSSMRTS